MADSEVRQKFEATERERKRILGIWTQEIVEQMRHNFQGHHIPHSAVRLWLDRTWDEAYSAGMRAGEIAEREKIRNAARAEYDKDPEQAAVNCADTTPESIYLNGFLVGIEAVYKSALPAAPEEKKP